MSPSIFFAHANGFPSATYGKLFAGLAPDYKVLHLPQHGHDARFPVDAQWSSLVDELLHHLHQQAEPVWGVGHSLGGILHYHAALRCPELYRGVIMLDSPLLTFVDRLLLRTAKRFGFIDRITPAARTLGRREAFEDPASARAYFAGKSLFRRFDPECLDDYIRFGLHQAGDGLRLSFDPGTEISIYRNIPDTAPGLAHQLQVPLAVVRGRHSRVMLPHHVRNVRYMRDGKAYSLAGGHMFPLERPQQTAQLLKDIIAGWQQRYTHKESA